MRLRSLRKLEEMEIRREHDSLTKERKELTKLLGSEKLKSEKLIEELQDIDAKFGLKTELGKRRTQIAKAAEDKDANATPDFKTLVEWSEKALGAPHPCAFSMWKQDSEFKPGLSKHENDWIYQFKLGDAPVAVIVVGKAEG